MIFFCLSSNDVNSSRSLVAAHEGILLEQANVNVAMSFCNPSFPCAIFNNYFSGKALVSGGVTADENADIDLDCKESKFFFSIVTVSISF